MLWMKLIFDRNVCQIPNLKQLVSHFWIIRIIIKIPGHSLKAMLTWFKIISLPSTNYQPSSAPADIRAFFWLQVGTMTQILSLCIAPAIEQTLWSLITLIIYPDLETSEQIPLLRGKRSWEDPLTRLKGKQPALWDPTGEHKPIKRCVIWSPSSYCIPDIAVEALACISLRQLIIALDRYMIQLNLLLDILREWQYTSNYINILWLCWPVKSWSSNFRDSSPIWISLSGVSSSSFPTPRGVLCNDIIDLWLVTKNLFALHLISKIIILVWSRCSDQFFQAE